MEQEISSPFFSVHEPAEEIGSRADRLATFRLRSFP